MLFPPAWQRPSRSTSCLVFCTCAGTSFLLTSPAVHLRKGHDAVGGKEDKELACAARRRGRGLGRARGGRAAAEAVKEVAERRHHGTAVRGNAAIAGGGPHGDVAALAAAGIALVAAGGEEVVVKEPSAAKAPAA